MSGDKGGAAPVVSLVERVRPRLLTVAEAAEVMRVSTDLLYDLIRDGQFPAIKMRGRFVIPLRALQQLEADALRAGSVVDVAGWTSEWFGEPAAEGSGAGDVA